MLAAELLMAASVVLMLVIVGFLLLVNRSVQRHQREQHFGDVSHVRIPDDPSALHRRKNRPKPPYRPL